MINVQVQLSDAGETQLFLGAYGDLGVLLFEEAFEARPNETMTQAMEWGIQHAKQRASMLTTKSDSAKKPDRLPRSGSNQPTNQSR